MLAQEPLPLDQHNIEIAENQKFWDQKPLLRRIYRDFHETIASYIRRDLGGITAELGSGIGNIKDVIPECLRTDLFPNPWLDQLENAYALSFQNDSVSNLILFDVFHHLRYPGTALDELRRTLKVGGRVIIFDPCISALGAVVFGVLHHEPVGYFKPITWKAPQGWDPKKHDDYYAAQGNATRVFGGIFGAPNPSKLQGWNVIAAKKFSALSYLGSGGYRGAQMYPDNMLPLVRKFENICDYLPSIFATRLLVVLEKAA